MAITVEYQLWSSGAYNWLDKTTSTSAPLQLNDKLNEWIAAVNASPTNASKQISVKKQPADSTSANFIGWVIELAGASSGAGPFYVRLYSSSTTNLNVTFSGGWTNDGTNGGYGATAGTAATDTTISWYTSGQTAEFTCVTETAAGEEFFLLGWRLANNGTYSDALLIFKDQNGEWAGVFSDGGQIVGTYYMAIHTTPQRTYSVGLLWSGVSANYTNYLDTLVLGCSFTTGLPAFGNTFTSQVRPASNALIGTSNSSMWGFGRWAPLSGSKTGACVHNGPFWVIYGG